MKKSKRERQREDRMRATFFIKTAARASDVATARELKRLRAIERAAINVEEYARIFLFALTGHDKYHQQHYREMLSAWLDKLSKHRIDP